MESLRSALHNIHYTPFIASGNIPRLPEEGDKCLFCWRPVGRPIRTSKDKSSPEDPVCRPVALVPCGHSIGYQCFHELCLSGNKLCPLCRRELRKKTNLRYGGFTSKEWTIKYKELARICDSWWFRALEKCFLWDRTNWNKLKTGTITRREGVDVVVASTVAVVTWYIFFFLSPLASSVYSYLPRDYLVATFLVGGFLTMKFYRFMNELVGFAQVKKDLQPTSSVMEPDDDEVLNLR